MSIEVKPQLAFMRGVPPRWRVLVASLIPWVVLGVLLASLGLRRGLGPEGPFLLCFCLVAGPLLALLEGPWGPVIAVFNGFAIFAHPIWPRGSTAPYTVIGAILWPFWGLCVSA